MSRTIRILNPDYIGALSSCLCLIHCLATPFLFIAKACSATCCSDTPQWWQLIDYLFLIISFFAIYYAVKKSSKKSLNYGLWISWGVLCCVIINETLGFILLPEWVIYIPAFSIILLHLYNHRYCQCANDKCVQ